MSLIFFKNNKPDNRMIEYNQTIVRLGLEKAMMLAELDRTRSEVAEVGSRHVALLNDIADAEKRLQTIRQEVIDAVRISSEKVSDLSQIQQESGQAFNDKMKELKKLEEYLVSLQSKIVTENDTLNAVNERIKDARESLSAAKQGLDKINMEKQSVEKDIISLQELKKELVDIISASEEKLKYLSEKEQSLNRKEADLVKYEERVKKMREDKGNKIKMIFK